MGKKTKQKNISASLKEKLRDFAAEKNPVLVFLAVFAVFMSVFYIIWVTDFFKENIFNPVLHINAQIASVILNVFGYGTTTTGEDVFNADFTVSVRRGCDAIEPIALYVCAVLAFPAAFAMKMKGIVAGVSFLLLVNMVRILSLFLTGIYAPAAFEFMHMEVWQVVFIVLAIACWLVWLLRVLQSK